MPTKPCALITGGGTGIGRAAAERFLKEGWRVVAVGRRLEPLQALASSAPGDVLPLTCDLTDPGSVPSLCERLKADAKFGSSLSVLVNNAGLYERRAFTETDDAVWTAMFETNLLGAVRLTRGLLPLLIANRGAILNVSSTLALKPVANTTAYSALKAAMVNWTEALALELGPSGVRCNCICPGIVDTPIHPFHGAKEQIDALKGLQPLGRIGQPEDIAHAIWSLCGPGSEWITGSVLTVDGGIHLL